MSQRTVLLLVGLVIATFTAVVIAIVTAPPEPTAAHHTSTSSAAQPSPRPAPPPVVPAASADNLAAQDAARQGLAVAYTWYPRTDSGPRDAFVRARPWLSPALAQRMLTDAHTARGPGLSWDRWAGEGAEITAKVQIGCSGCPPDTGTLIHRVATIHQTAITRDHTVTVEPDTVVWVIMAKVGEKWLIDTIEY